MALGVCLLVGCLLPAFADSAAPDAEAQATIDRSVRFLQEAQNADGGFGGKRGAASDPDFSAWAAYALAAAGINPRDQAQPGGVDVYTYLTQSKSTAGLKQTTDFDRVALVALAADTSPYEFGAVHPIEQILSRQLADGSFAQKAGESVGLINSTAWSIFPLSTIETPAAEEAVRAGVEWLLEHQHEDGSWGASIPSSPADSDLTGAVIEALNAAGDHDTPQQAKGFEYLHTVQGADGGFSEAPGGATNSATTAWVIQAIWSAGLSPREWRTESGIDPLGFLASLQQADGSIRWTASSDLNSLWMTAQVLPALAGRTYPLRGPPPREEPAPERTAPKQAVAENQTPESSSRAGHGGTGFVTGDGVIAGGGGRGAKLFSAPQPQSGGSSSHGSRQLGAHPEPWTPSPRAQSLPAATGESAAAGDAAARSSGEHVEPQGRGATVEGELVGSRRRHGPAASGLFGADSGGRAETGIALALVGTLLAAGAVGARRERAGTGRA